VVILSVTKEHDTRMPKKCSELNMIGRPFKNPKVSQRSFNRVTKVSRQRSPFSFYAWKAKV